MLPVRQGSPGCSVADDRSSRAASARRPLRWLPHRACRPHRASRTATPKHPRLPPHCPDDGRDGALRRGELLGHRARRPRRTRGIGRHDIGGGPVPTRAGCGDPWEAHAAARHHAATDAPVAKQRHRQHRRGAHRAGCASGAVGSGRPPLPSERQWSDAVGRHAARRRSRVPRFRRRAQGRAPSPRSESAAGAGQDEPRLAACTFRCRRIPGWRSTLRS